tara:strand:- start:5147 stop:6481 length:1335 start_codon:yes stop_codon:yes gene_type:complete
MEEVNINLDSEPLSKPTVNFGPGIELLMNDKKMSSNENTTIELDDLDTLEKDMNNLSGNVPSGGMSSNLFMNSNENTFEEPTDSNLGNATSASIGNTQTWDGFSKLNETPVNEFISQSSKLSEREKRRKKRAMLKKLDDWYEKGHNKNSTQFDMNSVFEEVEDEYETVMEDKRKKDSVKLQGWWFMTFINSIEYANTAFNPFDLNLDGWGEQVNEDIDSYEEIFSELHDKYKGGKLAPEISLLLRVGFSAAVLNFSNKALSSATPAFNDVIKQSPELMKMFTDATVNSMSQQSPGFNMANNLMGEQATKPRGPPPPAPVDATKQAPPSRMNFTETPTNRPDINASRGTMFREQGVDMNGHQNLNENKPMSRPEMKGPQNSDIDNILAGLKTKTINIHENEHPSNTNNDSVISLNSLNDMEKANGPKTSKRKKNRSDKNIISLDI